MRLREGTCHANRAISNALEAKQKATCKRLLRQQEDTVHLDLNDSAAKLQTRETAPHINTNTPDKCTHSPAGNQDSYGYMRPWGYFQLKQHGMEGGIGKHEVKNVKYSKWGTCVLSLSITGAVKRGMNKPCSDLHPYCSFRCCWAPIQQSPDILQHSMEIPGLLIYRPAL